MVLAVTIRLSRSVTMAIGSLKSHEDINTTDTIGTIDVTVVTDVIGAIWFSNGLNKLSCNGQLYHIITHHVRASLPPVRLYVDDNTI